MLDASASAIDLNHSYQMDAFVDRHRSIESSSPVTGLLHQDGRPRLDRQVQKKRPLSNDVILLIQSPRPQRSCNQFDYFKRKAKVESRRQSLLSVSHKGTARTDFDDSFNLSIDICALQAPDERNDDADNETLSKHSVL
jgi:hypothetical protein